MKESVIYASGVKPRTDRILRAFAAKNGLTLSQLMDILAHIVCGYDTMKVFEGKAGEYNPTFEKFDLAVRGFMEDNMPEEYRKFPLLKRLFGNLLRPITRKELDAIDRELASEKAEEPKPIIPEVEL